MWPFSVGRIEPPPSKTFTRQTHADWHLKVFLLASLAWVVIAVVPLVYAFVALVQLLRPAPPPG